MKRPNLFRYDNYRHFLRDWFAWMCELCACPLFLLFFCCGLAIVVGCGGGIQLEVSLALTCAPEDGETDVPRNTSIVCDTGEPSEELLEVEAEETSGGAALSERRSSPFKTWGGTKTVISKESRLLYEPSEYFPSLVQVCYLCNKPADSSVCEEGETLGCFITSGEVQSTTATIEEVKIEFGGEAQEELVIEVDTRIAVVGEVMVTGSEGEVPVTSKLCGTRKCLKIARTDGDGFPEGEYKVSFNGTTRTLMGSTIEGEVVVQKSGTSLTRTKDTTDKIVPTCSGATGAKVAGPASIELSWETCTDNVSSSSALQCRSYQSTSKGGQDFSKSVATAAAGATSYTVTGLSPDKTYYFVVRCLDEAGNEESNAVEVSGTTSKDTTTPSFKGVSSCSEDTSDPKTCSIKCDWSGGSDDANSPGSLTYKVYREAKGSKKYTQTCDAATLLTTSSAGATSVQDNTVSASTTYCYRVRALDSSGNEETNTACVCATVNTSNCSSGSTTVTQITKTK